MIRYIRGYELISSDSEKAKTYYHYTSDELGSITHVTDEAGNVCNYYEYDAFGDFKIREESIPNRFGYTGEQYDTIADLYYLRARFYNPVIGRFIQEDTYYGDGLNLYSYCQNNPVRYVDPSGHDMCPKKQAAINELMKKGLTEEEAENYYNSLRNQGASDSDAWKAIDEYRSRTDGLEPLGDTIPQRGDGNGTVAFIEVNGEKIFGVNSSLLSETDKMLGKQYFADMKKEGYFNNVKAYGSGSGQVFTHAEGYSLMRVHSIYGNNMPKNITIYCDRRTCGICQTNLPYFKEYFNLDSLTVINKDGKIFDF